MTLFKTVVRSLLSIPGYKTDRKLVLFMVDDYGSIRMSSLDAYRALEESGIKLNSNRYNRFETIESNSDLELLFEVLLKYKDKNGHHPVITPLVCVANPDFEKIKNADFREYYYEPFTDTLKRYPEHDRVYDLWRQGIDLGIFIPQFHGREHLNVKRWMADLQAGVKSTRVAFDHGVFGIGPGEADDIRKDYQAAFDIDKQADNDELVDIIDEGLTLFKEILGYGANYFTPANALFNHSLESVLKNQGVSLINVGKLDKEPLGDGKARYALHYLGQKNKSGQRYVVRNALFEPNEPANYDWVDRCIRDIETAFKWKKPAIISSHRVNFSGFLNKDNRGKGLHALEHLINEVQSKWPDCEFISSFELEELLISHT